VNAALRILAWTLALLLVTLPVVAVVNGWIGAGHWPLRTLRIEGRLQRVDAQRLRATVLPYAAKGFFAVRLADAQAAVAQLPWVERAEVRKRWPDVLEVSIVEHRPFAQWGSDRLLSEHVVALYNESRALFAPGGVDVRALTLDPRGSWSLVLSNGTDVIVGSSEARLRLARFARLMPQLLSQKQLPLVRADLRYTNGFALSWGDMPGAGRREPATGTATPAATGLVMAGPSHLLSPVTGSRLPVPVFVQALNS